MFSFGSTTSGIPEDWRATSVSPGVNLLDDLSETTAARVCDQMRTHQQPGDLIIASIHWGGNWGYEIPREQIVFAHRLIEEGVAIVHGHSSHHVKAIEVFKDRLILYGCGDFITDYEGISGYEMFRGDLALMYLVELDPSNGKLISARLVPMQMRRFRLECAAAADAKWLCNLLNELGARFGTGVKLQDDNSLDARMAVVGRAHRLPPSLDRQPKRLPYNFPAGGRAPSARKKRSTSAGFLSE